MSDRVTDERIAEIRAEYAYAARKPIEKRNGYEQAAVDLLTALDAKDARLREAEEVAIDVTASLAAAVSLLERTPQAKKAAPSDNMFTAMLSDYRKALARARTFLKGAANG